ncbi:caspase, EACC1-associated type [Sphaerisporangium rhizosphaerae]|uniref:Caspase family protein n=1 Tax=Sphaerisporangium rhizosphaerae TaxID=2269375 RepID=A0ABW2P4Q3_9ACTN
MVSPSGGTRAYALLIATDHYDDPAFGHLRTPGSDAAALAAVLADPLIGGYAVRVLHNRPAGELHLAVEDFFDGRGRDDLLFLYLSGHGYKDDFGVLSFAARDSLRTRMASTSVAAEFVRAQMHRSRSRRIVVALDCCYSGAFPFGTRHRGAAPVDVVERLSGRGRVVLTATSELEYAFEVDDGNRPAGVTRLAGGASSVFSEALIHGLRSGEADRDGDGYVDVGELYDYVYDRVRAGFPQQTPKMRGDIEGTLHVARSPRPHVRRDDGPSRAPWRPGEPESGRFPPGEGGTSGESGRTSETRTPVHGGRAGDTGRRVTARRGFGVTALLAGTRRGRPGRRVPVLLASGGALAAAAVAAWTVLPGMLSTVLAGTPGPNATTSAGHLSSTPSPGGSPSHTSASDLPKGTLALAATTQAGRDVVAEWTDPALRTATYFAYAPSVRPSKTGLEVAPPLRDKAGEVRFPKTLGKVFFRAGGERHWCSATSVQSKYHNVVVTAAHCVYDPATGRAREGWAFVPGFYEGRKPYGLYVGRAASVDTRFLRSGDQAHDVAFVVVYNGTNGERLGDTVGGQGLAWNLDGDSPAYAFGYPAGAHPDGDRGYTGVTPKWCAGTIRAASSSGGVPRGDVLSCPFTPGADGGPLLIRYDKGKHLGYVAGVVAGYADADGDRRFDRIYSPGFGDDVHDAYERAAALWSGGL